MRWWSSFATLLAVVLTVSAESRASEVRLVFTREPGAEACPDEPAVRLAVAARLGYDPFVDGAAGRTVRVVLAPAGRWLRASIELVDELGELQGVHQLAPHLHGCDALASAMELAIAIAIDPLRATGVAAAEAPSPSPSPSPPPLPAEVLAPPLQLPALTARPRRAPAPDVSDGEDESGARLVGRLAILAAIASAPNATWGIEAGLGAEWRRFSIGAELRGDLPGSRVAAGGTVSSSLVVVNLLPCVRAYGLFFCGLLSGGVLIAYGADFIVDRRAILPFFGGGARVGIELRLTRRLALGLHADLLAPFTRAVLEVDDQVLFRAPPVSGAFGALVSGVLR
jgi:hypothetical protein